MELNGGMLEEMETKIGIEARDCLGGWKQWAKETIFSKGKSGTPLVGGGRRGAKAGPHGEEAKAAGKRTGAAPEPQAGTRGNPGQMLSWSHSAQDRDLNSAFWNCPG
ncbi:hypothetical protein KIL84_002667 [Mauremys mutica]|uniref:Uncharacterized protein n=1 Tax=Mauremys mutica TaxID=74926 RepID=A0A9D3WNA5_9SAUR|nr:hypothetical protein KIL84_002667 [Mauremys mutica]